MKNIAVHGHRGSRGTHPENTIAAFQEAAAAGAHYIELDVRLTKDNVLVVYHNPEITGEHCLNEVGMRVTTPIPIRTLTAEETQLFDCGSIYQPKFPSQNRAPSRIPLLEEVLAWREASAPNLRINIEVKMDDAPEVIPSPELAAIQVVSLLRKHKAVEKDLVQSFDHKMVHAARRMDPKVKLACLFEKLTDFAKITVATGAQVVAPLHSLVDAQTVQECRDAGLELVPWTVNGEPTWRRLIQAGVDGIITDFPRQLIEALPRLLEEK